MKAYKFKLEGLLKIRRFKETQIKVELGKILNQITETEDRIKKLKEDIELAYKSQERAIEQVIDGKAIQFYPRFIKAKKDEILQNENTLFAFRKKYQEKVIEMNAARGDTKIVENMKEKDFQAYKKERERKIFEDIEDIYQMRKNGLHYED